MKKISIVILLLLPFVLSIMISLTGKIISLTYTIPVEKISFVDALDEKITENIIINVGEDYTFNIKIEPSLASNKKYSLKMDSKYDAICRLNDGKITGLSHGFAEISVISSYDRDIIDSVMIKVSDENVRQVTLPLSSIELKVSQTYDLVANVLPITATNKTVHFSSSAPEFVSVSSSGKITVNRYTASPVVITVTSAENSNIKATCVVTINNSTELNLVFNSVKNGESTWNINTNSLDLLNHIFYNNSVIDRQDIVFSLGQNASSVCSLNGSNLTINVEDSYFQIVATWTNGVDTETTSVWIFYTNN